MDFSNWIYPGLGLFWWVRWITPLSNYTLEAHIDSGLGHVIVRRSCSVCTVGLVLQNAHFSDSSLDPALPLWEAHPGHGEKTVAGEWGGAALSPASVFKSAASTSLPADKGVIPWSESSKLSSAVCSEPCPDLNHDQINNCFVSWEWWLCSGRYRMNWIKVVSV